MASLFVTIAFVLTAACTVPRLVKRREYKDLIAFIILSLTGFVLAFLLSLGVELPSPARIIMSLWDAIGLHF
ncbi:MAG: hypothetical protein ACYCX2_01710 [Christensenellales bacterium]